jgi:hypothetical protein
VNIYAHIYVILGIIVYTPGAGRSNARELICVARNDNAQRRQRADTAPALDGASGAQERSSDEERITVAFDVTPAWNKVRESWF